MELIGESHLDVAEDNYKVVPLRDGLLLLHGPHYVNVIKLGDSVLFSRQLDDTNKRNIFRYLQSTNKILHVGKDNTVKILSPTHQGIFVLGDTLNDDAVRISFQESIYLLETLQNSDMNWGPDTEDISQRVEGYLQNHIPELQMQPPKKQQWLECVLEGKYSDLEPLLEDISSQRVPDSSDQSATITKMLQRLRYNASHHLKHPSSEAVVSISVSPTEEIAVTGSSNGTIAIWDISKTPRLVNTISGPEGLVEVLLGEVVVAVHKPNVLIVHQIGEHALSETLFQQSLEGVVILGAAYVSSTQKVVLVLNVIGSPAKACYFLQTAGVNLEDRTLELGERVRVEGNFVAIASTSGTNTVSIDAEGQVILFDSSSGEISNTFQKPESNYRFSDVTSRSGHVYAATLAGTILSFNLANLPRTPIAARAAPAHSPDAFGDFSASHAFPAHADDSFGDFSTSHGTPASTHAQEPASHSGDPFGDFSAPRTSNASPAPNTADPFGDFSAPQAPHTPPAAHNPAHAQEPTSNAADPFGDFSAPQAGNNDDDFGFGDFAAPTPAATANGTATPPRNGTPTTTEEDEFGFGSSSFATPAAPTIHTELSPKFLMDGPGAGIVGSAAAHNSSTGDFGELPGHGAQGSPVVSKLRQSAGFQESPYSSPLQARKSPPPTDLGGFGDFSTSSPSAARKTPPPHSRPKTPSTDQHPFADLHAQDQFGDFGSQGHIGDFGTQEQFGEFGDFGATPQAQPQTNGAPRSATPQEQSKGDFGDLSDFASTPASSFPHNDDFGDFSNRAGTPQNQNAGDFGDFSTTPSTTPIQNVGELGDFSSTPVSTSPTLPLHSSTNSHSSQTNLHSSTSSHTSTPSTPGLHASNFRLSSSVLPASPSIFSQDFGFETPPPASLSHSPPPTRQSPPVTSFGGDFGTNFVDTPAAASSPKPQRDQGTSSPHPQATLGDFGDLATSSPQTHSPDFGGDFGTNFVDAPGSQTSPKPHRAEGAASPQPPATLGDFGDLATSLPQTHKNDGDFTFDEPTQQAAAPAHEGFGDFGENPTTAHTGDFGDFGESSAAHKGDFGESTSPTHTGDFGETTRAHAGDIDEATPTHAGDFGEASPHAHTFSDFGESEAPTAGDFGDFGESPATSNLDSFGDFGDSPAPQTSQGFGGFDEFSAAPQPSEGAAASSSDDFGDFGDFSAPSTEQKGDEDEFGDFGDFSKPQESSADEDFGDFGSFNEAPSSAAHADHGFGEAEAATATPTPAPPAPTPTPTPTSHTPSIFTQDEKQLAATLNDTFTTAFASLVPSSLRSPPSSPRTSVLADLDLEASLKGKNKDTRNPKCAQCGVVLHSADASSCLVCGAPAGPPQVSTWLGVVLPPIAEIKFWDALGVPLKQMTETNKEAQSSLPALSSSQGILTPTTLQPTQMTSSNQPPSLPSTQPSTQSVLSTSWDFSENPFAPKQATNVESKSAATLFSAATAKTPAATPASASANAGARPPAQNAQPPAAQLGGFGGDDFMAGTPFAKPSQPPAQAPAPAPRAAPAPAPPRSADDDFFLSFESSATPAPTPAKSPSLLPTPSSTTTPSASPWHQFLSRIPDLSFATAEKLVIPSH